MLQVIHGTSKKTPGPSAVKPTSSPNLVTVGGPGAKPALSPAAFDMMFGGP